MNFIARGTHSYERAVAAVSASGPDGDQHQHRREIQACAAVGRQKMAASADSAAAANNTSEESRQRVVCRATAMPPDESTKASTAATTPFWRSINCPIYVASPMVDQSERAFRLLCRRYNAHLCYTPMLHARKMTTDKTYLRRAREDLSLSGRPVIAQLAGNDAGTLIAAARSIESLVDAVDLNFG